MPEQTGFAHGVSAGVVFLFLLPPPPLTLVSSNLVRHQRIALLLSHVQSFQADPVRNSMISVNRNLSLVWDDQNIVLYARPKNSKADSPVIVVLTTVVSVLHKWIWPVDPLLTYPVLNFSST